MREMLQISQNTVINTGKIISIYFNLGLKDIFITMERDACLSESMSREPYEVDVRYYDVLQQGLMVKIPESIYFKEVDVYIYPGEYQFFNAQTDRDDEYKKSKSHRCKKCDNFLKVHYSEPFASCECGTQEWYK